MTTARRRAPDEFCLLAAALLYGVWIYGLLPRGVTTLVDDFSYYRSAIATLQFHRPWTDDFLEPWSVGLSVLSAATYALTRSFAVATQGLMVALGAVGFWALGRLLRDRGFALFQTIGLTGLILSFPMVMLISTNFLSMVLYIPCLLLAVHAAQRERWLLFAVVWVTALSTRQTGIFWALLPLAALLMALRDRAAGARRWVAPAAVLVLGVGCFAALWFGMNRTAAQEEITRPQMLELLRALRHLHGLARPACKFATGVSVLILSMGIGWWVRNPSRSLRGRAGRLLAGLAVVAVLIVGAYYIHFRLTYGHHRYLGIIVTGYLLMLTGMAVAGLADFEWDAVSWPLVAVAVAGSAAISAHQPLQIVYLLEPALLGFLAVRRPAAPAPTSARRPAGWWRGLPWGIGLTIGLCNLAVATYFKVNADLHFAGVRAAELALRENKIAVGDLPRPFTTLVWWRVLPYIYAHSPAEEERHPLLDRLHTPGGRVVIGEHPPRLFAFWFPAMTPPPRGSTILGRETFRCGWFFVGEVVLYRTPGRDPEAAPAGGGAPADYHPQNYPLNDAEWREFIRTQPATGTRRPSS